jgi:Zn-dependent protease
LSLLNDLTLSQLLTRLVAFLIVTALHGFVLAGMAALLGDQGPRYNGRLTLNPVANLSMLGLVMTVLFNLGWIMPMRINPEKLRFGRLGLVICLVAGLLAVLVLVPLLWPLRSLVVTALPRTAGLTALVVIGNIQDVAMWFVAFNVLPIPPLAGALLVSAIWPPAGPAMARHSRFIEAAMVVAVVVGLASVVADPIHHILRQAMS